MTAGAFNAGGVYFTVDLDTAKLIAGERRSKAALDRVASGGEKLQATMTKVAAAVGAALSAIAIEGLVSKIVTAQRSFDVMFASLKTMTGGVDQAGAAFERLRKFAAQTPYTLEESVNGFVKLKALGLDPSERAMTSFGNTAAAMGKNLAQMIEAVADASTGEFERLKEFGIKASVQGDKVALTFRGTTTTVQNSAGAIVDYLTRIGEVDFAGAMAERMKTLDGDISNLQDSLSALYLTISQSGFGEAIAEGVRMATQAITEASTSIKEGGLTEYFDDLKPFITAAEVAVVTLAGAIAGRLVVAFVAAATQAYAAAAAIGATTLAARGFGAVLAALGGPIGIAITGLALLALNWDKVAGEARDAATMSEEAAARIAAALRKAPERATGDLKAQLADVRQELGLIDKELGRSGPNMADPEQLQELRQRRDTLVKIAGEIQAAMVKANGGDAWGGEGRRAPGARAPGPAPAPRTKDTFDDAGYLAGLAKQTAEGLDRVNQEEAEALRKNQKLLDGAKISRQTHAAAITLIEANAVAERRDINLKAGEEYRQWVEKQGQEEVEQAKRFAQEKRQAEMAAQDVVAGNDPVQQELHRFQRQQEVLDAALARQYLSEELHNAAIVANRQQMVDRLKAIEQQRADAQTQAQIAMLNGASSFFGASADLLKDHEGEQGKAYRTMFALQKAFAIASSLVAISNGAAKAWELGWPAGAVAAASVLAQGASLMNTIRGAQYGGGRQYGGPVSAGSMYRVNETGAPEMFVGSGGRQYMMPTQGGQVVPADQVGGGAMTVEFRVINQMPGAQVSQRQGADGRPELVIAEVAAQIAEHRGPVWGALASTTNTRARL